MNPSSRRRIAMKHKLTVKKILRLVSKYRFYILLSLLFAIGTVALTLYIPILIGHAIDAIVEPGQVDFEKLSPLLIEIAVMAICVGVFQWIMNLANNRIAYLVVRDMRKQAIRKIQALPLSYIDSHAYGDVVSRVIADVDQFADGLLMGFTQFFTGILTILGTVVMMIKLNWEIAIAVILLTPLSMFVAKFISGKTYSLFKKQTQVRGKQTAFIDEMISSQKVVQAFTHEDETLKAFDECNEELGKWALKATFFSSLTNPSTRFINNLIYAAVALLGAVFILFTPWGGALTVGGLNSLLSYANQYTKPFNEITGVITELQGAIACADRIFEFLEEKELSEEAKEELGTVEGNVSLENVAFSYVPERPLIQNFNLTVKKGERIAIVGPTGCGKTTLINLLMRFYDVDEGSISLEGEDIRTVTRWSLRKNYGMVLQETWLKRGTVRDNIVMGKEDATDEEVIAAAKSAHAHSFIMRLPKGYDTVLTEDSLSAGQRQLLCIARIMLVLPPMVILDEATSSIDTRTELKIQEAFNKMMKGRTSFIVAHRLSTIREADVILVMHDGNIVEQGKHDELLARNGFYAKLYHAQFEA
ncbi:MAG: ABC transporter ATP-binding protein [Clostridia bacterium]|nr:ABC transporter ATP-binding protein [Clostridia bacterium]